MTYREYKERFATSEARCLIDAMEDDGIIQEDQEIPDLMEDKLELEDRWRPDEEGRR